MMTADSPQAARIAELRRAIAARLEAYDAQNPVPNLDWQPDSAAYAWARNRVDVSRFCPEAIELRKLQMDYVRSLKGGE